MALRSLVVKLKALPRRMPGLGSFAPKGNPLSKSSARLTEPTEEEAVLFKSYPHLQRITREMEESEKRSRADVRNAFLAAVFSAGFMGYVKTYDLAKDYNKEGSSKK